MESKIKVFESKQIRTLWNQEEEEWYFSVVDVIEALTLTKNPRSYWYVLKNRLKKEGSELLTFCKGLKMIAPDGKSRTTDSLNTKGILRLVQSIPSPKAEPFKVWLAQVGSERLEEIADPEKAIIRGANYYGKKGYSDEWIRQRLYGIEIRKKLTDEWKESGVSEGKGYAILTDEMTKAWSGMSVKEYKQLKGLNAESLRDNMTDIELVLNMLAEVTTTEISMQESPTTFRENESIARRGGKVANAAKKEYEEATGSKAISSFSAASNPSIKMGKKNEEE